MHFVSKFIVVMLALPLGACSQDPVLNTDSPQAFERSYERVVSHLSPADREKLDKSLHDIVLVRTEVYGPMLEVKLLQENLGGNEAANELFGPMLEAMRDSAEAVTGNQWDNARPELVIFNARQIVDGRTASEIFVLADEERQSARDKIVASYQEQIKKAQEDLDALNFQQGAALARETLRGKIRNLEGFIQALQDPNS